VPDKKRQVRKTCSRASTLKGVECCFLSKGFSPDPLLQNSRGADRSFQKVLPSGGRKHSLVYDGTKYITIREHVDRCDPMKNPIGHLEDILDPPKEVKYKLTKRRTRRRVR